MVVCGPCYLQPLFLLPTSAEQGGESGERDDEVKVYYVATWLMQHVWSAVIHHCQTLVESS